MTVPFYTFPKINLSDPSIAEISSVATVTVALVSPTIAQSRRGHHLRPLLNAVMRD
jgi:hypothetical protein